MQSTQRHDPLNIIVIGAGIGGLATALGLRRQGHDVRVFEKSNFGNEIGAAIVVPANVYPLMKRLGVSPEEHGANTEDMRSFYTMNGDLMFETDLTNYGGAARLIHRVDLHDSLKDAAIEAGVQIFLAHPVQSVNPAAGSVTLSNGNTTKADVIIGADGVHSISRRFIAPDAPSPSTFHLSMFRMLIPCSKLADSSEVARFINPPGKMTIFTSDDGRRVVSYPCRSNSIMNVAVLFPASHAKEFKNDADLKRHMLKIFSDYHPSPIALLKSTEDVGLWTLYDMPPLSTWSNGCATLAGDAAHPILPFAAQGGAQALEDAATLTVLLGRGTPAEEVSERLKLYFEIRHGRTDWIQDFARSADQSSPENPGVKPNMDPTKFYEAVHDHEAWSFAEEKLTDHLRNRAN